MESSKVVWTQLVSIFKATVLKTKYTKTLQNEQSVVSPHPHPHPPG